MKDFDHWRKTALEELIQTEYPICYGVLKPGNYDDSGVPLLRIVDLESNVVRDVGLHQITQKLDNEFSRSKLKGGELLVSIQGTVGRVAIAPEWAAGANISRTIARVAIAREKGNAQFIRQWLLSGFGSKALKDSILGTTRDSLNLSALRKIQIPLPSPPEQTKIAEILSTVDRAIEHTEAIIAKQQRIKTGVMQDLLTRGIDKHGNIRSEETHEFKDSPLGRIPGGWEVRGFENYVMGEAGIKPGPFGSSLTKDMHVEAGYRVYGQEQVIGGTLDIGDYFITGHKYSEMSGFAVEEGDVLISLVGTIGHVLIVPHRYHPGVINPRLLRFRPDPRHCVPQFLKALLLSQPVRLQLDTFATGGTMPVLSGGIIRKLRVVILGLNEQKRIIQMIASSEAALLSSSTHLAKLRSLKTALMQDLLTGKKRVTTLLNDTEVVHG